MPSDMSELNIAEIPYDDGAIRYRYARKMAPDGTRWIRDGLFQAFHPNGSLASEGTYREGAEDGAWRDYHDNGQLAAEGSYSHGSEVGVWRFWNSDGTEAEGP
jgi:antitoxin component YwqK of YwqJK toxin-antitoxin module